MVKLLTQFPDLAWLKAQVAQGFAATNAGQGWPTVILHTQDTPCYRPDISGPLSLFVNLQGRSLCGTGAHLVRVEDTTFFLSNQDQAYTLAIEPQAQPVETFNIHFGKLQAADIYRTLLKSSEVLLDDEPGNPTGPLPEFYSKLYERDETFNYLLRRLHLACTPPPAPALLLDELLAELLGYLLVMHRQTRLQVERLPFNRPATRTETYRRLAWAADYAHTFYQRDLSLDELAQAACLSRFHFLRLFRACYGQTPYQYLSQLRLEKARTLLRHTALPVSAIAVDLGFQNLSSFCRLFQQRHGVSAQAYRLAAS